MGKLAVNLVGGLGNQLFQYAFGRALSLETGLPLALDLSEFRRYKLRKYLLDRFAISASVFPGLAAQSIKRLSRFSIGRMLLRLSRKQLFAEPHFHFEAIRVNPRLTTLFQGYWQSEKYFSNARPTLLQDLALRAQPREESARILESIRASSAPVALHVRRGDYVSDSSTQAHHGTCSLEYYRDAVEVVRSRLGSPRFFIFSDDPEWTRSNLKIDAPATYITHNPPESPEEDLRLMSACSHFVIANSSLSWWGAWLSSNPSPLVIAPKRWFRAEGIDTRDLIPAGWMRI